MKRYTERSFSPDASDLNHKGYGEGVEHYKKGNFNKAKHAFETALEYCPLDPQAWFALGNCFDELNKPSRAEKCFRKAMLYSAEEKLSDVYFNLGNALFDQNNLIEAADYYRKVSAQSSSYSVAQKNLKLVENELSNKNT
jgi:tetratricopeptide (TPR) repeat protein